VVLDETLELKQGREAKNNDDGQRVDIQASAYIRTWQLTLIGRSGCGAGRVVRIAARGSPGPARQWADALAPDCRTGRRLQV